MQTRDELRQAIDRLDGEIVSRLDERFRLSRQILEKKLNLGEALEDKAREAQIIEGVGKKASSENRQLIENVYRALLQESKGALK